MWHLDFQGMLMENNVPYKWSLMSLLKLNWENANERKYRSAMTPYNDKHVSIKYEFGDKGS